MSKTVENLVNQAIGITVKHYNNSFKGVKPPICRDFGESNTDKSTYRPDLSLARAYQGSQNKKLIYDFDDGKDTGETVQTYVRSKGLDITEIETAQKRITQIIEDKKEKAENDKKSSEAQQKFINDLSNAVKGQDSTNSEQNSSN